MKQAKNQTAKIESNKADLTHLEDLSIAVMNLISLEEHFAFTTMKAKKKEYLEILGAVRKLRIKLLRELVHNNEGELWCISKHLLAATMRLMETATKYIGKNTDKAYEYERAAFDLYTLFRFLQRSSEETEEKPKEDKTIIKENA